MPFQVPGEATKRPASVNSDAEWEARSVRKRGVAITKKRMIIAVVVILLIIGGIVAGVVVSQRGKSADKGDPSAAPTDLTIHKNAAFTNSFHGLAYTPLSAQYPWCGATLTDIVEDIKVLSQLTTRLRLYGMDCNQADYTLEAIRLLKVPMTVILTVWVDTNATTYQRQVDTLWEVLAKYGTGSVDAIAIGNEAIFRQDITIAALSTRMTAIRTQLAANGYPKVPVVTSELGSLYTSALISASDETLANIHPYFAGVDVTAAPNWTDTYFAETIQTPSTALGRTSIIGEVGWPTAGASQNSSVASTANLQYFLDNWLCQANAKKLPYYFFEAFDEPWKQVTFTLLEASWGILDTSRAPKVILPKCPLS